MVGETCQNTYQNVKIPKYQNIKYPMKTSKHQNIQGNNGIHRQPSMYHVIKSNINIGIVKHIYINIIIRVLPGISQLSLLIVWYGSYLLAVLA